MEESGVRLVVDDFSSFMRSMDRAGDAVVNFGGVTDKTGRGISAFGDMATGAFMRVGEIAVESLLSVGSAMIDFGAGSIKLAADYESTLNNFASVTGDSLAASGKSISDFSDLFLEMGAVTKYSAAEAAQAAVELAKGGLAPATIAAGGLEGALGLAAAGQLELAESAEITAKQLGIWGSTGVDAIDVADRLAQAANASTTSVQELALGLANTGGTAKVAGASFDETVQALALLSPGFSSAADAGTSFKVFLSRLIPVSGQQVKAMSDLNLLTADGKSIFYDTAGAFVGMEKAAQILQDATKDLTQDQRLFYLNLLFGQDAVRAGAMIAEAGAEGYRAMGEAMKSAGTAAEQAEKANQGLNFSMESLAGSMENLRIVAGMRLTPTLTALLDDGLIPIVNAVFGVTQSVFKGVDALALLDTQNERFNKSASDVVVRLDDMERGFARVGEGGGIGRLPDTFDYAKARADAFQIAIDGASKALEGVVSPKTLDAFRGFGESLIEMIETILPSFNGMGEGIEQAFSRLSESVGVGFFSALQSGVESVTAGWDDFLGVVSKAQSAWSDLNKAFSSDGVGESPKAIGRLNKLLGSDLTGIITKATADFKKLQQVVSDTFGRAFSNSAQALPSLASLFERTLGTINRNWEAFRGAFLGIGALFAGGAIVGGIATLGAALLALVTPINLLIVGAAGLGAAWSTNFMGIRDIVGGALDYLSDTFGRVGAAISLFGGEALAEITRFVTTGEVQFTALNTILGNVGIALNTMVSDLVGYIQGQLPTWQATLVAWGNAAWEWLSNAIPPLLSTLATWGASLLSGIGSALTQFQTVMISFTTAAFQWLGDAIPQLITNLGIWSTSLITYLGANLPMWIAAFIDWSAAAVTWLTNAIPPLITAAGDFLVALLNWSKTDTVPAITSEAAEWGRILWVWVDEQLIPAIAPALKRLMDVIVKALKDIASAALSAAMNIGKTIIDGVVEGIQRNAQRVWDSINNLFGGAEEAAQQSLDAHSPSRVFMRIGESIISGITSALTGGDTIIASLTTLFSSLMAAAQQAMLQWSTMLAAWGQEAWMWLQKSIPLVVQQASLWGGSLLTSIATQFPLWVQSLFMWGLEAWEWLRDALPPLTQQMLLFHQAIFTWANALVLPTLVNEASNWAIALYMWIPNELIPGIQPMWDAFLADCIMRMQQIEDAMLKAGKKVGQAIIKGTVKAIEDGKGKIIMIFKDIIDEAIAEAKQQLGISSPSKVFYTIGSQIMQGLQDGIANGATAVATTLYDAVDTMTSGLSPTITLTPQMAMGELALVPALAQAGTTQADAGLAATTEKPINPNLQYKPIAPPATSNQMNARATNNTYTNTSNYNLSVETNRSSQGVQNDFAVIRAMSGQR